VLGGKSLCDVKYKFLRGYRRKVKVKLSTSHRQEQHAQPKLKTVELSPKTPDSEHLMTAFNRV
jgi:hypothetical protein